MTNFKKLSELYSELDKLLFIRRDVENAKECRQTFDHIFNIDISPRVNSRSLNASKVKYRKELLHIIDSEIERAKQEICQLAATE